MIPITYECACGCGKTFVTSDTKKDKPLKNGWTYIEDRDIFGGLTKRSWFAPGHIDKWMEENEYKIS